MRAVRIHEYGGPEQLRFEENVPEPQVTADTVLIETAATSVNPIDWKIRSGARQKDFPRTLPTILGRDVSGIVRTLGANVHNFKVGDRVAAFHEMTKPGGSYAEFAVAPAYTTFHIPQSVSFEGMMQAHL